VDHSVYVKSFFCQPAKPRIIEGFSNLLIGCEAVPPIRDKWLREQVACIPTIGRLARQGAIRLGKSHELWREATRGRRGSPRQPGFAFEGCEWEEFRLPIERFLFLPLADKQIWDDEPFRWFCELVLETDNLLDLLHPSKHCKLSSFELKNIREKRVFEDICHSLSRKHWPDAFHLWTAEVNGANYFLTVDKTFKNALSTNRRMAIRCEVIFPDQLLGRLGVSERDPLPPLIPGRFYTMGEAYHLCKAQTQ
jgi:hypothetical protein